MRKRKTFKNCFISAPSTVNLIPFRKLLETKGIETRSILSASDSNLRISTLIENEIKNSDFVCAIIPKKVTSGVYYELGLARGAKKPIFIIIEKEGVISPNLENIVYVIASIKDQEVIEFALDQFLSEFYNKPIQKYHIDYLKNEVVNHQKKIEMDSYDVVPISKQYSKKQYKESKKYPKKKLDYSSIKSLIDIGKIESSIIELFENLEDVITVRRPKYSDKEVDLSLWIDGLKSGFGNPVLVEVKSGKISNSKLEIAENQLRNYLIRTNASLGLLIYIDNDNRTFKQSSIKRPLVIWFELNDLILKLSENSLAQVIEIQNDRIITSLNEG